MILPEWLNKILFRHLIWTANNISFLDVQNAYDAMRDEDPFDNPKSNQIHNYLRLSEQHPFQLKKSDLLKLNYLFITDNEFDGNIDFIAECKNLESIYISGLLKNKIKDIEPFKNLQHLKHLELDYHQIENLDALSDLNQLEALLLSQNPVKTLAPLFGLKNLKTLSVCSSNENEIFELLQYSPTCIIDYCEKEPDGECFSVKNIKNWPFKYNYMVVNKKLELILRPILIDVFKSKSTTEIETILNAVKQEAPNIAQQILKSNEVIQLIDFIIFNDVVVNGLFLVETS